jgi:lysophospholipase L1-like esterase
MRNVLFLAAWLLLPFLYPTGSFAQNQKKIIVVLGSSTAEGVGVINPDSAYVRIVQAYYQNLGLIDTIYDLALSGFTTYYAMPSSYVHPPDRPEHSFGYNVTAAMALNPDVVLVNFPTNDIVDGETLTEYLSNLHVIYDSVIAGGKVCYVTTTQPLDYEPVDTLEILRAGRDSILAEFGAYSIDFYDPLVASDSLTINPLYYLDGTHVNAAGHRVLAQAVINANILSTTPLPLALTAFSATPEQQGVLISWTDVLEEGNTVFGIQRSADGSLFPTIAEVNGQGGSGSASLNYTWTDEAPLNGKSYYRLKITQGPAITYSRIVTMDRTAKSLSIVSVYLAGGAGLFTADINTGKNQTALIRVFNAAGTVVWQQPYALVTPTTRLSLDLTRFAKGAYFLQVTGADGEEAMRGFPDF